MSSKLISLNVKAIGLVIVILAASITAYLLYRPFGMMYDRPRQDIDQFNGNVVEIDLEEEEIPPFPIPMEGVEVPHLDLATLSPLIEEAKALVHDIPLKSPDRSKIPEGFNVKEILYRRSRNTYEFEGKEFTPEHLWIFLWNRTLGTTPFKDFQADGGISIEITYGPGSNETGTFIYTNMKPGGDFSYLWGYPTVAAEGYLVHFNFDTGITYRITGNYPTQVLIRVLESLLLE